MSIEIKFVIFVFVIIFIVITWLEFKNYKFEYSNDFKRYCCKCGQDQEEIIVFGINDKAIYRWTVMGEIIDSSCWCHDQAGANQYDN